MAAESEQLNFEGAAQTRDRIAAIQKTMEKQLVVSLDFADRDVFGFYRDGSCAVITGLFIRSGRMIGSRSVRITNVRLPDEAVLSSSVYQYYDQGEFIPDEVITGVVLPDSAVLEEWLSEKKEATVKMLCPQRGPLSLIHI